MWNHPKEPPGVSWGHNFKKAVAEVATVELRCFLCHRLEDGQMSHEDR